MLKQRTSLLLEILAGVTFLLSSYSSLGQQQQIDSLHNVLAHPTADTVAFHNLITLSEIYDRNGNVDSALKYGLEAKIIATKLNSDSHIISSLHLLYWCFFQTGNHSQALKVSFELLKHYERLKDSRRIARTLSEISNAYDELENFDESLAYQKEAYYRILQSTDKWLQLAIINFVGYAYLQLHQLDSSLVFYQKANEMLNSWKDAPVDFRGFTMYGLGRVNYLLGNVSIATPYYYESIRCGQNDGALNPFNLLLSYSGIAEIFEGRAMKDSALVFYQKALDSHPQVNRVKLNIYKRLIRMYDGVDNNMALKYFKLESALRDSLLNARKIKEAQTLLYNERERQEEILIKQVEERKARRQNIQYGAIGVGTISFFVLFILLSRTIIVSTRAIRIFGIVGLLITFEFINLLIHPFLERITHHSPFLILIAMVCIAALIVPIHHKLEKWMIRKLQENNIKIRLAAAKKTIAELDEQQPLA
jgi:tetratricopeptide (TPR) repeat protein